MEENKMCGRFLFCFVLILICLGSPLQAQERLNLAYISPNASASSVLWVAKEAGLYKKHGLDVNLIYRGHA